MNAVGKGLQWTIAEPMHQTKFSFTDDTPPILLKGLLPTVSNPLTLKVLYPETLSLKNALLTIDKARLNPTLLESVAVRDITRSQSAKYENIYKAGPPRRYKAS
jgi:hypothetical protein